jgi:hypothetical protein
LILDIPPPLPPPPDAGRDLSARIEAAELTPVIGVAKPNISKTGAVKLYNASNVTLRTEKDALRQIGKLRKQIADMWGGGGGADTAAARNRLRRWLEGTSRRIATRSSGSLTFDAS